MNCTNCGMKIMASVARQQEDGETLCRECYTWKRARENQAMIHEQIPREE